MMVTVWLSIYGFLVGTSILSIFIFVASFWGSWEDVEKKDWQIILVVSTSVVWGLLWPVLLALLPFGFSYLAYKNLYKKGNTWT